MSIIYPLSLIDFEGNPITDMQHDLPLDDGIDTPDENTTDNEPLEQKEEAMSLILTMITRSFL